MNRRSHREPDAAVSLAGARAAVTVQAADLASSGVGTFLLSAASMALPKLSISARTDSRAEASLWAGTLSSSPSSGPSNPSTSAGADVDSGRRDGSSQGSPAGSVGCGIRAIADTEAPTAGGG